MNIRKERVAIRFRSTKEFFNGDLYVGLDYPESPVNDTVLITVGRDGMGCKFEEIRLNQAHTFTLQNAYEVRVFDIAGDSATVQACELPIIKSAEHVFQSSKIFQKETLDENFSIQEIQTLRHQLTELENKLSDFFEMTTEEAEYSRAAFKLLSQKLDSSSKSSWRQAAYGVLASISLSLSFDLDQDVNYFNLAESYLSTTANLILGKS